VMALHQKALTERREKESPSSKGGCRETSSPPPRKKKEKILNLYHYWQGGEREGQTKSVKTPFISPASGGKERERGDFQIILPWTKKNDIGKKKGVQLYSLLCMVTRRQNLFSSFPIRRVREKGENKEKAFMALSVCRRDKEGGESAGDNDCCFM